MTCQLRFCPIDSLGYVFIQTILTPSGKYRKRRWMTILYMMVILTISSIAGHDQRPTRGLENSRKQPWDSSSLPKPTRTQTSDAGLCDFKTCFSGISKGLTTTHPDEPAGGKDMTKRIGDRPSAQWPDRTLAIGLQTAKTILALLKKTNHLHCCLFQARTTIQ